jgi:ADP-ribose pyrophosphatase YjhB (NUDIX family)
MKVTDICPVCGHENQRYVNPLPTVDIIIEIELKPSKVGIVLIERRNFPFGWAIPGGFVDYGETVEAAAIREAFEETSLKVELKYLLGVYSAPNRDPRQHTISVVFVAQTTGTPHGRDDAMHAKIFELNQLPKKMAFDHRKILADYLDQLPPGQ